MLEIDFVEHYQDQKKTAAGWFFGNGKNFLEVIFVCPFCERAALINGENSNHRIADDGSVNPSIYCDCGKFHAYIKLAKYQEELTKRKQHENNNDRANDGS